jgi:hypothetical protein
MGLARAALAALAAAALGTGVLAAGPARAETATAEAAGAVTARAETAGRPSVRFVPVPADAAPLGPDAARGVVVWSHGRSAFSEDSDSPAPPYLLAFRAAGFDVLRFDRLRDADTLEDGGDRLAREAEALAAAGYRRVVLAGQSFGGFLSLIAAGRTDAVDAVIATAPAAYGSFHDAHGTWLHNAHQLWPLLEGVRTARVLLAFFHGDEYDPGGRGARADGILAARGLPRLVVDQPADLAGHGAAGTGLFVRRFADCLVRFAERAPRPGDPRCESDWGRTDGDPPPLPVAAGAAGPAALAGDWRGFYVNGRAIALSVEPGADGTAQMDYALGEGVMPGQPAETTRRAGRADEDGALVFDEPGLNPLRLTLRPDGRATLVWTARDGEARLEATLIRARRPSLAERGG